MPVRYLNFDIDAFDYVEDAGGERFSVRVAESPAGQQRLSDAEQVPVAADLRRQSRRLERRGHPGHLARAARNTRPGKI